MGDIGCVEKIVKLSLNVGSGQRPFTSTPEMCWFNIDSVDREGQQTDMICDGSDVPFAAGSVDYVVLHHVCEHGHCNEATGMVQEAHRVLRPGGSLLVFVPDLRMLADRWLSGQLTTQIYMTSIYGAYMGNDADCHHWGFDRDSLHEFLSRASQWSEVKLFDWRELEGASIARDFWIAGMECVR